MNWWKQKFIEHFQVNHLCLNLMDLIDEEQLLDFIWESFRGEFTKEEIIGLFKDELSQDELNNVLYDELDYEESEEDGYEND